MINVKRQTKRVTKWLEKFANNINIFYGKREKDFQFGLVTSADWGDFTKIDIVDPAVEIVIDGVDYSFTLSNFKSLIVNEGEKYGNR